MQSARDRTSRLHRAPTADSLLTAKAARSLVRYWRWAVGAFLICALPRSVCALTLFDVLERVRSHHPALRAAAARIAAARQAWIQAGRWKNPELELRSENLHFGTPLAAPQPSIDFFATLTQVLEVGGKPGLRQAVAAAEQAEAEANRARVDLELRLSAIALFFTALRAQQEAAVLNRTNQELERLTQIATLRVRAGHSPRAEAAKLRAEQSRFRAQLSELSVERQQALTGLQLLLGSTEPLPAEEIAEPPLPAPPEGAVESLIDTALRHHPDYRLAAASRDRAERQVRLERARQIPDPALTAGYKRTESTDTWVSGVTIPLPILDTNRANVQRALAEHQAAEASLSALELELKSKLAGIVLQSRELFARAQRLPEDLLEPAAAALHAARVSVEEGGGDLLALVDATRVHADAQRAVIRARAEAGATGYTWQELTRGDAQSVNGASSHP